MSASSAFDPAAYVAEMHEVGARLVPTVSSKGRRAFAITPGPSGGIPGDVMVVGAKWAAAAKADPDWLGAVHGALMAQGVPA